MFFSGKTFRYDNLADNKLREMFLDTPEKTVKTAVIRSQKSRVRNSYDIATR